MTTDITKWHNMHMKTLGQRLKKLRLLHGFTQKELAERVGITQPAMLRCEQGKVTHPRMISKLARVLGVTASYLQFGDNNPSAVPLVPFLTWQQISDWLRDNNITDDMKLLPLSSLLKPSPHAFLIQQHGDLLAPRILDQDILLVDPDRTKNVSGFVVVQIDGQYAIRHLITDGSQQFLTVPNNASFSPVLVTDDIKIIGTVVELVNRALAI